MKKYLVFTIILFFFGKVYAEDIIYSEWSSEYPTNVSKLIIKKEYRYLWYKEEISDIKYLREEEATDRIIDYNDMILKKSENTIIRPESYPSRELHMGNKYYRFKSTDIDSIKIVFNNLNVYELEIFIDEVKYDYLVNDYDFLSDSDYDSYFNISDTLNIKFSDKVDANKINVKIYCESDIDNNIRISFKSYIYDVYYNDFNIDNEVLSITASDMNTKFTQLIPVYRYTDKLYKTYKIVKEYTVDYYNEMDGYIKDESTKKAFYRYIKNKYIIVDYYGRKVTDENYCLKNKCTIKILSEHIEENPKTGDFVHYSFIVLFITIVIISLLLYIFYKKIVSNKSSFVESL